MAFRQSGSLTRFNSANSSEFISFYENHLTQKLIDDSERIPHATFAPSSFRCARKSWFRLRQVKPDKMARPDIVSQFKADMGTSCHMLMQNHLKEVLGADWIDVEEYFKENPPPFKYKVERNGLECFVSIDDPPFRFACDGIIRWKGSIYLIEIKTLEYSTFQELANPLSNHLDQIVCYSTLYNIPKVLFIYQDRQYGTIKCYEVAVSEAEQQAVQDKVADIRDKSKSNLAPERLPRNDAMCGYCEYKKKCLDWG